MSESDERALAMTVGWGMIGIGTLADVFIAPAIARHAGSELVAVCSRSADRAQRFAERHGGRRAYGDYDAMLADTDVGVVYIASPNALHGAQMRAAISAGKHVLVEKPMVLDLGEGREIVNAAASAGVLLAVGFQLRHKATNLAARQAITDGRIGRPAFYELSLGAGKGLYPYETWRADEGLSGGGTLLNQGTHPIDMLQFLSGEPIVEVTCLTDRRDVEEVVVTTCRLAGGALAILASNQVLDGTPRNWLAVGDKGWLQGRDTLGAAAGDEVILQTDDGAEALASSDTPAYDAEIEAFAAAVAGGGPVNGSGEDGLRTVAVVEAMYRSARSQRSQPVEQL